MEIILLLCLCLVVGCGMVFSVHRIMSDASEREMQMHTDLCMLIGAIHEIRPHATSWEVELLKLKADQALKRMP